MQWSGTKLCGQVQLDRVKFETSLRRYMCMSIQTCLFGSCDLTSMQGKYALSEQKILANNQLCANPSSYNLTQLRADYTNCGLPNTALDASSCIEGTSNEPNNCGFGYATVGLCQYCTAGGENPTDPCCARAQASVRCANVVLPTLASTSANLLTSTSTPTSSGSVASSTLGTGSTNSSMSKNANGDGGLSGGAIAGIVIGGIAGLVLLVLALLFCCCIRPRRKRAAAKQKARNANINDPTRAMVFIPNDSSIGSTRQSPSYFGRSASESEGSYSRPLTSSRDSPSLTSGYAYAPRIAALRNVDDNSEIRSDIETSTHQAPSRTETDIPEIATATTMPVERSSAHRPVIGNAPRQQDASAPDGFDFVLLPGGRRARISVSSDRPLSSGSVLSDRSTGENRTSTPKNSSRRVSGRPSSKSGTASSATKSLGDFEVLPGGRIARRSGVAGHVGGIANWNSLTTPGRIDHTPIEAPSEKSVPAVSATEVETSKPAATAANTSLPPVSVPEAELIPIASPTRGPTMPPNSSIKDYYTINRLTVGDKVKAVWSYAAKSKDEFTLERGDALVLTSIWADGWATGHIIKESTDSDKQTTDSEEKSDEHSPTPTDAAADEQAEPPERKALPLVCVCAYEYWDKVIKANGQPLATHSFDLI